MAIMTHPNGAAPLEAGRYKLGAKGGRMAKAWQFIWDQFDGGWKDGLKLAHDAAAEFDLKPVTVSEMLCRMRAAGVIEQEMIYAATEYVRKRKQYEGEPDADYAKVKPTKFTSNRERVHYRINPDGPR